MTGNSQKIVIILLILTLFGLFVAGMNSDTSHDRKVWGVTDVDTFEDDSKDLSIPQSYYRACRSGQMPTTATKSWPEPSTKGSSTHIQTE